MTGQVGPLSAYEAAFAANFVGAHLGEVQGHFDAVSVPGVVVGMAPGPSTSEHLPMFPWPEGSAGGRLLAMSGMPAAAYLGRLRRHNVCAGRYRAAEARETAKRLVSEYRREAEPRVRFVLCGRRVAEAFELGDATWFSTASIHGIDATVIPHPSGRCREYNDPAMVARARDAVRWAARWEQP